VSLRPLELFHFEARVLEELPHVGDARTPLRGQAFSPLAVDCEAALERRAEAKMLQVDYAGGEPPSNELSASVDDDCVAGPNGPLPEQQLERLERASGRKNELRRRVRPEPVCAQVADRERSNEYSVATKAARQIRREVRGIEAGGPEVDRRAAGSLKVFMVRPDG
jgi:hypothetical protein